MANSQQIGFGIGDRRRLLAIKWSEETDMMRRLFAPVVVVAIVVSLFTVGVTQASAASIDFRGGLGGTVSWAGGSAPLVGANIAIDTVEGQATPSNPGNHSVTGGLLNFTTGNFVSSTLKSLTFGAGGSIAITGGVPDAAIIAGGSNLVSNGSFSSSPVLPIETANTVFVGFGTDTKLSALLAFFGLLDTPFHFAVTEIHLLMGPIDPITGAFSAQAQSTDFNNQPVPEPASAILLGTGLLGMGVALAWRRRRA